MAAQIPAAATSPATATDTSTAVDATWTGNWVKFLVSKFGTAASGGVAVYDLDNEPSLVECSPSRRPSRAFTYDEVTNNGIAHAAAIKAADPTAEVSGPVMDLLVGLLLFQKGYRKRMGQRRTLLRTVEQSDDRNAHGGVPLIEYYLQQFAAYAKNERHASCSITSICTPTSLPTISLSVPAATRKHSRSA